MIHGTRQARAAMQTRAVVVVGVILALFVSGLVAMGAGSVEFAVPWKLIATAAVVAVVVVFQRLR